MASFSIPLTGLEADSQALDTISNNLANMNTTAYKDQTTSFASLFYQQLGESGDGDPLEQGLGVQVETTSMNFSPGTINNTGVSSDMAINGSGFFVAQNAAGQQFLTQAGNFTTNANGNLVTSNGLDVMGYPAVNGTINTNGSPSPIVIPINTTQAPHATQNMSLDTNLDATAAPGTSVPVPVTLYDSLGNAQQATATFTANGGGSWSYAITVPGAIGGANSTGTLQFNGSGVLTTPGANISGITFTGLGASAAITNPTPTTPTAGSGASATFALGASTDAISGTLNLSVAGGTTVTSTLASGTTLAAAVTQLNAQASFSGAGLVASQGTGANANQLIITGPAGSANTLSLTGTALADTTPGTSLSDGANPLTFSFNLFDSSGNATITQTASASATTGTSQDGYTSGQYQSFSVDPDGVISATYSNGLTSPIAQLAIASVTNEQGLSPVGGNDYLTTLASGQANLGVAGTGDRGSIEGSSLEASNVDISTEFANLIVAQNAFDANSKSITTFDTVTQDTINMIR